MATTDTPLRSKYMTLTVGFALLWFAVSCSSAPTPTASSALSTLTPIPSFQFVLPTGAPQLATLAAATVAASNSGSQAALDPEKVTRGKDRYVALGCNACHGDNGEGTNDGSALAGITLNEADFISFLRSGGSVGSSHQYSTNRLSDSGSRNLYEYLRSLEVE